MKLCLIGGGAGGASVAARVRRLDEFADIILFDKDKDISKATCGIPYYIGDVIKDRKRMIIAKPEAFSNILNVDVRTQSEVLSIDRDERSITVKDLSSGNTYKETYDKLVLAPGSIPLGYNLAGSEGKNVFSLQTLDEMDRLTDYFRTHRCLSAVIVGGGYIGLEAADNLHNLGLDVTLIEGMGQVMNVLDYEMAAILHQHLEAKKIKLVLSERVKSLNAKGIELENGQKIPTDFIILAMGTKPNNHLAEDCGLAIGALGGICVNGGMKTSDENIYALGDAVETNDLINSRKMLMQLAGPAHKQASVIADNLCGRHRSYKFSLGNTITKVLDYTVAITGYSEKRLQEENISYKKSYTDVPAHAEYYPKSYSMLIKLLFAVNTGRVLGAQIIGIGGVDKRIDVISAMIQHEKTVYDLAELELSYAPPYSAVKDPVNVAGMVARNMLQEGYEVIYWDEVALQKRDETVFIDVRSPDEHHGNVIKNSINIPLEELRSRIGEIPKNKKIIFYCQQGKKGYFACKMLMQNGYQRVYNLSGGLKLYNNASEEIKKLKRQILPWHETEARNAKANHLEILEDTEISYSKTMKMIDARGLNCPGPILELAKGIRLIKNGECLRIVASDPGFYSDVSSWCKKTGNRLYLCESKNAVITAVVQKREYKEVADEETTVLN